MAAATAVWDISGALRSSTITGSVDSDSTVVERCLSGDGAAWEELVRLHTRRIYGLCFRFTGKDSEAQDLTQEVFLRVSDPGSFAPPRAVHTWLARLTRNLLIDHYRRTKNERITDSIEEQYGRGTPDRGDFKIPRPPGWRGRRPRSR